MFRSRVFAPRAGDARIRARAGRRARKRGVSMQRQFCTVYGDQCPDVGSALVCRSMDFAKRPGG
eukprot:6799179-Prymnesium_polylepis.1